MTTPDTDTTAALIIIAAAAIGAVFALGYIAGKAVATRDEIDAIRNPEGKDAPFEP